VRRFVLRTSAWLLSLVFGMALVGAPIMHGFMVLAGRETADLVSVTVGPLMFVAGLGLLRVFGWLHEEGL
jgi:hypothetical protein